jgi:Lon protease-like protein
MSHPLEDAQHLKTGPSFANVTVLIDWAPTAVVVSREAVAQRMEHLVAVERMAEAMVLAMAHLPVAVGLLHFLRHSLLAPAVFSDP